MLLCSRESHRFAVHGCSVRPEGQLFVESCACQHGLEFNLRAPRNVSHLPFRTGGLGLASVALSRFCSILGQLG